MSFQDKESNGRDGNKNKNEVVNILVDEKIPFQFIDVPRGPMDQYFNTERNGKIEEITLPILVKINKLVRFGIVVAVVTLLLFVFIGLPFGLIVFVLGTVMTGISHDLTSQRGYIICAIGGGIISIMTVCLGIAIFALFSLAGKNSYKTIFRKDDGLIVVNKFYFFVLWKIGKGKETVIPVGSVDEVVLVQRGQRRRGPTMIDVFAITFKLKAGSGITGDECCVSPPLVRTYAEPMRASFTKRVVEMASNVELM